MNLVAAFIDFSQLDFWSSMFGAAAATVFWFIVVGIFFFWPLGGDLNKYSDVRNPPDWGKMPEA